MHAKFIAQKTDHRRLGMGTGLGLERRPISRLSRLSTSKDRFVPGVDVR